MLWVLSAAVVLIVVFLLGEYLTRRVRYFRKMRRNADRLVPNFHGEHSFSLTSGQKVNSH
jgi:hypothetical protein